MKTLVIHPFDVTTGFLSVIYENKRDWTVIDTNPSKKFLKEQIKNHNRIIMLGHGSEDGLFGFNRLIIDSTLVYLLREKQCVCIWCNANMFVEKYGLKGFYTGMIVSDYEEAVMYSINEHENIVQKLFNSNVLFAYAAKKSIDEKNMLDSMKLMYDDDSNPIIDFNKQNMHIL